MAEPNQEQPEFEPVETPVNAPDENLDLSVPGDVGVDNADASPEDPTATAAPPPPAPAPKPTPKLTLLTMEPKKANAFLDNAGNSAKKMLPDDMDPEKGFSAIDAIIKALQALLGIYKDSKGMNPEEAPGNANKPEQDNGDTIYGVKKSNVANALDTAVNAIDKTVDALEPDKTAEKMTSGNASAMDMVTGPIKMGIADGLKSMKPLMQAASDNLKQSEQPTVSDVVNNGLSAAADFCKGCKDMLVAGLTNDLTKVQQAGDKVMMSMGKAVTPPNQNMEDMSMSMVGNAPQMSSSPSPTPRPSPSPSSSPSPEPSSVPSPENSLSLDDSNKVVAVVEHDIPGEKSEGPDKNKPSPSAGLSAPRPTPMNTGGAGNEPEPEPEKPGITGRAFDAFTNLTSMTASAVGEGIGQSITQSEHHDEVNKEDEGFHITLEDSMHRGEGQFAEFQQQNAEQAAPDNEAEKTAKKSNIPRLTMNPPKTPT